VVEPGSCPCPAGRSHRENLQAPPTSCRITVPAQCGGYSAQMVRRLSGAFLPTRSFGPAHHRGIVIFSPAEAIDSSIKARCFFQGPILFPRGQGFSHSPSYFAVDRDRRRCSGPCPGARGFPGNYKSKRRSGCVCTGSDQFFPASREPGPPRGEHQVGLPMCGRVSGLSLINNNKFMCPQVRPAGGWC